MKFNTLTEEDRWTFAGAVDTPGMPAMISKNDTLTVVYDSEGCTVVYRRTPDKAISYLSEVINWVPTYILPYHAWETFWEGVAAENVDPLWFTQRGFEIS